MPYVKTGLQVISWFTYTQDTSKPTSLKKKKKAKQCTPPSWKTKSELNQKRLKV